MDNILENTDSFGILLALTFIVSFQIYFLIVSVYNRKNSHKLGSFVVVLVMVFLGYVWSVLPSILGYPFVTNKLPEKFKMVDYMVLPEEKKLLVWVKEEGSKRPRVYEIAMNLDLRKKMRKAKKGGTGKYTFVKSKKAGKKSVLLDTEKYDLRLNLKPFGLPDYKGVDKHS
jgi:hypothetical protein